MEIQLWDCLLIAERAKCLFTAHEKSAISRASKKNIWASQETHSVVILVYFCVSLVVFSLFNSPINPLVYSLQAMSIPPASFSFRFIFAMFTINSDLW